MSGGRLSNPVASSRTGQGLPRVLLSALLSVSLLLGGMPTSALAEMVGEEPILADEYQEDVTLVEVDEGQPDAQAADDEQVLEEVAEDDAVEEAEPVAEGPLAAQPEDSDQLGASVVHSGTWGECTWSIDSDGLLRIKPTNGKSGKLADSRGYVKDSYGLGNKKESYFPWYEHSYEVKSVSIDSGVRLASDSSNMFESCSNLQSTNSSRWDTSQVKNMGSMFSSCGKLASVDVSGWDTSSVTDMHYMFSNCSSLTSLDLSRWDTSSVTDMHDMFIDCRKLASVDVSGWDTSSVKSIGSMFYGCSALTSLDVSRWDTSSVTDMGDLFRGCSKLATLDVSRWDTSSVKFMGEMFRGCSSLASLDVSRWNTSKVTHMGFLFGGCSKLATLDVSGWNTSSVTSGLSSAGHGMNHMFYNCSSLTSLDLSGWDNTSVTYNDEMIDGCSALQRITVGSKFDTSKAFPAATASSGKWYSTKAGKWFTVGEIQSSRKAVADTYANAAPAPATQEMYRLYNPNSGEHFYTAKEGERDALVGRGWTYEGVGWTAPATGAEVYRLYNANAGDHHYTMKAGERDYLVSRGWTYEGVGWHSAAEAGGVPLYRQYNPNAKAGSHNYTTNKRENDYLVGHGWVGEGVGWYGVKQ